MSFYKERVWALAAGILLILSAEAKEPCFKIETLRQECKLLLNQKNQQEFEKKISTAVESGELSESANRELMNLLAESLLWTSGYSTALNLLEAASRLKANPQSNVFYKTLYLKAILLSCQLGRDEAALEVLDGLLKIPGLHPANQYSAYMLKGAVHEKMKQPDLALKCYQAALRSGKKVKFKFSCTGAEKNIKRLIVDQKQKEQHD